MKTKRNQIKPIDRAWEYAHGQHPHASPTWDGHETRKIIAKAWLYGYRAAQRDARRKDASNG